MQKRKKLTLRFYGDIQNKEKKTGRIFMYFKLIYESQHESKQLCHNLPEKIYIDATQLLPHDPDSIEYTMSPGFENYIKPISARFRRYKRLHRNQSSHDLKFIRDYILEPHSLKV